MNVKRIGKVLIGKALGLTENDLYVLRSMRHYWWLYARLFPSRTAIPIRPLDRVAKKPSSKADEALCERIIEAYRTSNEIGGVEVAPSPLWQGNLEHRYGRLTQLVQSGDPKSLADALANMFASEFVYGIDAGNLYTGKNWRVYSLKILDDLVSLAEQLGVVPTESGQAVVGQAFASGLEKLVGDTERALGISLSFPEIGAAHGMRVGDTFMTLPCCEYAYVAWRLTRAIESEISETKLSLIEVGAGYGGTAMFVARMLGPRLGQYFIADLPLINVLQAYFLGKVFGGDHLRLYGEKGTGLSPVFVVLPGTAVSSIEPVDVMFNQNSLPEIVPEAARSYLEWARDHVRLFFSYNHETVRPDRTFSVTTVPEMVARAGGLVSNGRNYSWLRPGYVEEVWISEGGGKALRSY